jgi:2'-5' RNA ligase
MKYFVGYLIRGQAAKWHTALSDDIANKFNIWRISDKNPPHITIYYPFEIEDISRVKNFLNGWISDHRMLGSVSISGFDRFEERVVFVKVRINDDTEKEIQKLQKALCEIAPLRDTRADQLGWHPHATLAYKIPEEKINEIWRYVKTLDTPKFVIPFDNISIFKWEVDKWTIEESLNF